MTKNSRKTHNETDFLFQNGQIYLLIIINKQITKHICKTIVKLNLYNFNNIYNGKNIKLTYVRKQIIPHAD